VGCWGGLFRWAHVGACAELGGVVMGLEESSVGLAQGVGSEEEGAGMLLAGGERAFAGGRREGRGAGASRCVRSWSRW